MFAAKSVANPPMPETTVDALIVDLLQWLSTRDRSYQEVIDAWRTSCPKLPIWEDAKDRGLVTLEYSEGREMVRLSSAGTAFLERHFASRKPAPPGSA